MEVIKCRKFLEIESAPRIILDLSLINKLMLSECSISTQQPNSVLLASLPISADETKKQEEESDINLELTEWEQHLYELWEYQYLGYSEY